MLAIELSHARLRPIEFHIMKGNGFDEEDFYITFFVLWSLGVLVVALWSTFLDLKLRRNNRRLTKTVKDQRVNKTVGGCAYSLIRQSRC